MNQQFKMNYTFRNNVENIITEIIPESLINDASISTMTLDTSPPYLKMKQPLSDQLTTYRYDLYLTTSTQGVYSPCNKIRISNVSNLINPTFIGDGTSFIIEGNNL